MVKQIRNKRPGMVDVGDKNVTHRVARARALVDLPPPVARQLKGDELISRKGPVFQTAVVAGIMAAKRTADLIPLCHPLALTRVAVDLEPQPERNAVRAQATVETRGRTGVEMEALTAVQIALLTVYDMCKAVDRGMTLTDIRLLEKSGGQSGVWRRE